MAEETLTPSYLDEKQASHTPNTPDIDRINILSREVESHPFSSLLSRPIVISTDPEMAQSRQHNFKLIPIMLRLQQRNAFTTTLCGTVPQRVLRSLIMAFLQRYCAPNNAAFNGTVSRPAPCLQRHCAAKIQCLQRCYLRRYKPPTSSLPLVPLSPSGTVPPPTLWLHSIPLNPTRCLLDTVSVAARGPLAGYI